MRWFALSLIDAIAVVAYVASALLVFAGASIGAIFATSSVDMSGASSLVAISFGALIAYLFAAILAPPIFRHFRAALREPLLREMRLQRETIANEFLKDARRPNSILFLHSFDTERNAHTSSSRVRDTRLFDALERYLWARAYVLFPLLFVVKLARSLWLRLPLWKSVDEHLSEAFWPDKMLLSVGTARGEIGTLGPAPVPTGERDWRVVVEELCNLADAIVVVPGPTPGIAEEILLVSRSPHLAAKTLFVWPPGQNARAGAYAEASDKLFQSGIQVPHFDERGAIFNLHGGAATLTEFLRSRTSARRAIEEMLTSTVYAIEPRKELRLGIWIGTVVALLFLAKCVST